MSEDAVADIYENDLRDVLALLETVKTLAVEDVRIAPGTRIVVESKNDYLIGTLIYEEDQWRFTPHVDGSAVFGREHQ